MSKGGREKSNKTNPIQGEENFRNYVPYNKRIGDWGKENIEIKGEFGSRDSPDIQWIGKNL